MHHRAVRDRHPPSPSHPQKQAHHHPHRQRYPHHWLRRLNASVRYVPRHTHHRHLRPHQDQSNHQAGAHGPPKSAPSTSPASSTPPPAHTQRGHPTASSPASCAAAAKSSASSAATRSWGCGGGGGCWGGVSRRGWAVWMGGYRTLEKWLMTQTRRGS
ncbi:uncharacterized protein EV422DRAFT_534756 [Fimicolochytrium jonesii]|uniref:uncharacterized protein n=1 Tax=Fimicolochytrium jonesii TaxID=1396493 RepID=UPI0022FF00A9|nr:uncharacterized protein EV422DRAFT_534756 [Fimicolochytrium jonesii]KAI8819439.1 hypothetical protein EV422DRAFT_534756 [Fimicolochytrium jonesii]